MFRFGDSEKSLGETLEIRVLELRVEDNCFECPFRLDLRPKAHILIGCELQEFALCRSPHLSFVARSGILRMVTLKFERD